MLKRFLIVLMVMLFVCAPLFSANAQDDLKKEVKFLKQRVQQLEEKLKEQEESAAQDEEAQKEERKELAAILEAL
ncbi:MAG TPA: hypothetical protein ENN89_00500, partial [Synergistetes bacterium]|nr:hypothetical protein [Synergistota bacterium]